MDRKRVTLRAKSPPVPARIQGPSALNMPIVARCLGENGDKNNRPDERGRLRQDETNNGPRRAYPRTALSFHRHRNADKPAGGPRKNVIYLDHP